MLNKFNENSVKEKLKKINVQLNRKNFNLVAYRSSSSSYHSLPSSGHATLIMFQMILWEIFRHLTKTC